MQKPNLKRSYDFFLLNQGILGYFTYKFLFSHYNENEFYLMNEISIIEKSKHILMTEVVSCQEMKQDKDFSFGPPKIGFDCFYLKNKKIVNPCKEDDFPIFDFQKINKLKIPLSIVELNHFRELSLENLERVRKNFNEKINKLHDQTDNKSFSIENLKFSYQKFRNSLDKNQRKKIKK